MNPLDRKLLNAIALIAICFAYGTRISAQDPEPWTANEVLTPKTLADRMASGDKPDIFYVGFPILYKGAHIRGAQFAGPCSKPEGLDALKKAVAGIPHDREVVIYCGCCPFTKCPNIRPAYRALKDAGYTHIEVLQLDTNLHTDWTLKGYPVVRGDDKPDAGK